jgi:hypothetical protein
MTSIRVRVWVGGMGALLVVGDGGGGPPAAGVPLER